ncbi:kinase-like protein [Rickenella mellea]|uniref:Kinase-like protein n=1 Tax=Rickenella mellea TaxID=50990 RepID=A0A4Y7PFV2_9AGAM|nr:kinase-like protein [Rickenella mellea]
MPISKEVSAAGQGAANLLQWSGKTVQAVVSVPMLDTGLALIDNVVRACKQIPVQKRKVRSLLENCETLRKTLEHNALDGTLLQDQTQAVVVILTRSSEDVLKIPSYSLLKRLLMYQDIGDQLNECSDEIRDVLMIFNVVAHVSTHATLREVAKNTNNQLDAVKEQLREQKELFEEQRQLLRGVLDDKESRSKLQQDPVLAASVRAVGEADVYVLRQSPGEIDPEDIAEYEHLLQKMALPQGVAILTGQITSDFNRYGMGIYTNVYIGDFQGKPVSLKGPKAVSRFRRAIRRFSREVTVWSQLKHPNILPLIGLINDEDFGVCIVSPWQKNGDLMLYIEHFPFAHRFKLLLGAAQAIEFLHKNEIAHGNIKGRNILVSDEGEALVCDFKMAQLLTAESSSTVSSMSRRAITRWSAPEIVAEETGARMESDIYSFAMTILEALTMADPYPGLSEDQIWEGLLVSNLRPSRPASSKYIDHWLSNDLWDFMQECWRQKPRTRPTIDIVVKTMLKAAEMPEIR